jgi:hypothetical protein
MQVWSNLQCTCFAYITDPDVRCAQIQIYCYEATTTYSLHKHGVHFMAWPWARYLSRDVRANAHFLCDTAGGLWDTIQRIYEYNTKVQVMKLYMSSSNAHRSYEQTGSILMTCVEVVFIFASFWLKFFVQHSLFARGREMRSFFLRRTCYEVLRVSLTSLALPCPGPSQFFTSLLHM